MSRLADYFVVVGYDHEKERSGMSSGMILQRFPEKDWSDTPFMEGIEWFCQPHGWALSTERQEPRFFVSVLTDIDANRHYCACLCFNETVSITPSKPVDEEEDNVDPDNSHPSLTGSLTRTMPAITHHSIMYAPKCLVLVSRLDYIETFRNCLGIMYTVYVESMPIQLETLVGNVLGCIQVPPPGGPQVRFSIGAGDRQALQPPLSPSLPVTNSSVSLLFQQLGIRNVLCLFCAIMTEHKILFHSQSYSRLTEGSHALTALMYPFRYSHVYIPLLPAALVEVLSTPTPFIMGVHSSLRTEISDLMDVIVADLDGGSITVPDGVSLPLLPQPLLSHAQDSLTLVLQPELAWADHAFPPSLSSSSNRSNMSHASNGLPNPVQYQTIPTSPAFLDKEIRAVFMRIFAQLLQGYRSCLTIIRIHPRPVITFHKAAFLGERGLTDCDFTTRVLDCMFFTSFVQERGPPWRPCDVWDELHSNLLELLRLESQEQKLLLTHIQDLAHQLYTNENPNPQPYVQKILKPPDGAFARIHQPPLPIIDGAQVQAFIDDGLAKTNLKSRLSSMRPVQPRIVPMGPHISSIHDSRNIVSNSARRLEVLRNCINCIFENKISDARKTFPAVLRALKSKQARLALCSELAAHVIGNKAMLEHQQFDLVVRLMNCALQDDSAMDENGVAAALLPLATAFCRKLCTGVIQFAYTCIQDHPVWQNQQFWEAAFYQDVQKDIKALYLPRPSEMATSPTGRLGAGFPRSDMSYSHHHHHHHYPYQPPSLSPVSPREVKEFPWKDRRSGYLRPQEPSALEIAAEQMRIWPNLDPEKQKELVNSEESTMYSQAIHYANRMVYLLVPLDVGSKTHKQDSNLDEERASNSITNSVAESDSAADAESGFEEQDPGEAGSTVIRLVSRFVDKVCTEGGVSAEHVRCLHQMVPGVVHMHIETLEAVHRESKRLPPIQKPKILTPNMLPGEELVMEGLRVYLLPDGREEWTGGAVGTLLPAEGALFLTNYRIIFKGTPCDPFACEQVVVRAFPVTSLTKEKRISIQYLSHLDQYLQEGLQLRSCTFQLVKLAFDEEVTSENVESLRKMIHRLRHPPHVFHHFAFTGQIVVHQTPLHKGKEKNATLKGFAKKTLLKTARKAGFKQKATSKRQKYVLPNMSNSGSKYLTSPGRMSLPPTDPVDYGHDDDVSMLDEFEPTCPSMVATPVPADAKTLERLSERSYVRDWRRLGLCSSTPVTTPTSLPLSAIPTSASNSSSLGPGCRQRSEPFRITTINSSYIMCRSYPALLVVPSSVTDESVRRLSRCHRHCRFPAVTWRHPRTGALLVRGAGFHAKGVIGILKGHPSSSNQAESHSTRHGELQPRMVIPHQIASGVDISHSSAHPSATTASNEQEKYLSALVAATPIAMMRLQGTGGAIVMTAGGAWGMSDSSLSIDSLLLAAEDHLHCVTGNTLTPEASRRANPFNKAMGTLSRSSGGKGPKSAFGRWGSLKDRRHNSQISLSHLPLTHPSGPGPSPSSGMGHMGPPPAPSTNANGMGPNRLPNPRLSSDSDSGTECVQTFQRAAMYIFGEKAQMKGMKAESPTKADFIPVEYYDVRHTKASFKKLMRACIPSSSQNSEPEHSFHKYLSGIIKCVKLCTNYCWPSLSSVKPCINLPPRSPLDLKVLKLIESSDWLQQLQNIMQLAGAAVDLLDVQGSSVMICLEDGWDVTCQVSSVAQLCLDPHYRTLEGFRVLVEKEWLAFGHRFSHRSNLAAPSSQTSGFAPTFLQFLDAVHQIHNQFPLAFEFNDAYLRFLAYHYVSCRFRTFLLDSEVERVECGIAAIDDKKGSLSSHHKGVETGSDDEGVYPGGRLAGTNMGPHLGQSVFDYIEKLNARSPAFYNFMYTPDSEHPVLRPQSHLSNLDVWEYYLGEEMSHGPNYDFEVIQMDSQQEEEAEAADGVTRKSSRRVVTMGYDGVSQSIPDAFTHLLEEIHRLETELGHLPQKWNVLWDKLELPTTDSLTRHSSFTTQLVRWHGRLLHKRSTLEILMRGKMVGAAEAASSAAASAHVLSHPHRFERYNYTTPTYCDLCTSVLWGPVKTGMRCMDCGYSCHEKCMENVPKNCTKYKAVSGDGTLTAQTMTGRATGDSGSVSSGVTTIQTSSQQYYDQFSSNVAENRTHEGYLYKRGALLKAWKQRWFVLDSIKHQLRYYDAMEDSHCKGFIDLAEVMSVMPAPPAPGPPKKTDDKSFFDLRTNRRTYNFCASDATSAQEWIEKIQACLQ